MSSEWVLGRPAPALRSLVDSYVGYRVTAPAPTVHRGLPSRHLTLIASIGEPIDVVAQTDPGQGPDRYRVVLGGLQPGPALIAAPAVQEGVAIELTPLGCRALLGMPARALWNLSVEAADVLGPSADELWERLHWAADWPGRFATCDDVLSRRLAASRASGVPAEVVGAWDLVVASGGTLGVADVADRVRWSRRHLTQRFTSEFGLSPKLAARVVRFERAGSMLRSPRRPGLAEVAAACGYYDQPHLNRDFVALAGCPPREWLQSELPIRELPSVQDGPVPHPSGSAA